MSVERVKNEKTVDDKALNLPPPDLGGQISVAEALQQRRSLRRYKPEGLELAQVAQLLWAAQGITNSMGHRTAPSAGGLYPLELYLATGAVAGLEAGLYHYRPAEHSILRVAAGDLRQALAKACLSQDWIAEAPCILVIAAIFSRTNVRYGERTLRYVYMEVGAASENIALQAEALGLGTVMVGAFYELKVQNLLELPEEVVPLCLMPVGKK